MTAALEMSASASSVRSTQEEGLDEAVKVLQDNAQTFARLAIAEKQKLLRETMQTLAEIAPAWVRDGAMAKGISDDPGEEWLSGPVPTMRNLRLLDQTLERLRTGAPLIADKQIKQRSDGRIETESFPADAMDGALFAGFSVASLMEPGVTADQVKSEAGSFYRQKDPEGGVSLILGAGNVSSIPPTDALYKNFNEGYVCVVKMNPVNEWVGPHLERAFRPFIERGFMRIVYGGAEVGRHLVEHEAVSDIHITGSNHTHDMIVWGPPGEERERRKRDNDPLLKKRITSELGNVSPVAIVPADYSDSELEFMAHNLASMVANNGSFNCNAAKMLITDSSWSQRDRLLEHVSRALNQVRPRKAYYPGAFDRYEKLVGNREHVKKLGQAGDGELPWTLIMNVDAKADDEPLFVNEPFCAIMSETRLEGGSPAGFIKKATTFMNDSLWGTLNAMFIIHPKHEKSAEVGGALDRAIVDLRYGTVAVNHWPAVVFATMSPCWGGHPSSTLSDIQSGIGWVHNTFMVEKVEKSILRGPLKVFPKPAWFFNNRQVANIGRRLVDLELSPSWLKVPGIALTALRG